MYLEHRKRLKETIIGDFVKRGLTNLNLWGMIVVMLAAVLFSKVFFLCILCGLCVEILRRMYVVFKGGEIVMFSHVKNKRGFTLVELLIVIVILGILAAIVIARFAGATKETKEASLKGNLRTIRSSLEIYKANSHGNNYPTDMDDLWAGTNQDIDSKTFLERIPLDPFYKKKTVYAATDYFDPIESATDRDAKITGTGGWAYDSLTGRICANYYSTDQTTQFPIDTSWGSRYNLW